MGTSAAYNDKQRRVPFLIKNQLPTLTVRINLIGLTAGDGGSGELRYLDINVNSVALYLWATEPKLFFYHILKFNETIL